jgi:hypothetical protein
VIEKIGRLQQLFEQRAGARFEAKLCGYGGVQAEQSGAAVGVDGAAECLGAEAVDELAGAFGGCGRDGRGVARHELAQVGCSGRFDGCRVVRLDRGVAGGLTYLVASGGAVGVERRGDAHAL